MHDYAIEEKLRENVIVVIVIIYILFAIIATNIMNDITARISENYGYAQINYIQIILSVVMPSVGYGIFYVVYDKFVWKWFYRWHGIPNLNGSWKAEINSEIRSYTSVIEMKIKQTWTKIKVSGTSNYKSDTCDYESHTLSRTAAIIKSGSGTFLVYTYRIKRRNNKNTNEIVYEGYNKLEYIKNEEQY